MANISDLIEQYILSTIGGDNMLCISRNGLATYFNVAPSQINYVLSTRFSIDRGYIIESKRGGGGYLTVTRIEKGKNEYIKALLDNEIGESITFYRSASILKRLNEDEVLSDREAEIVMSAITDRALSMPDVIKDAVRAGILKSVLTQILKYD